VQPSEEIDFTSLDSEIGVDELPNAQFFSPWQICKKWRVIIMIGDRIKTLETLRQTNSQNKSLNS